MIELCANRKVFAEAYMQIAYKITLNLKFISILINIIAATTIDGSNTHDFAIGLAPSATL